MTTWAEYVERELALLRGEIEETALAQRRLEGLRTDRRASADEIGDAARDFRAKQDRMMSHVGKLVQQHVDRTSDAEEGPHPREAGPSS